MFVRSLIRMLTLLCLFTVACAPGAEPRTTAPVAPAAPADVAAPTAPAQPSRTLVTAIRVEPSTLASKLGLGGGATLTTTRRLFNAYLAIYDQRGDPLPYLAAELPQINTPSWVVSVDGRMVTTYKLRPNLEWHDGQPLSSDDFVFA